MKKINFIKFILDAIMGIIFSLLFNKNILGGLKFHEFIGIAIGFAVLLHLVLNWKWIINVSKSIFKKGVILRIRIIYILNVLLLLNLFIIIVSGKFISEHSISSIGMLNNILNKNVHIGASYFCLALIGIHIGLHWKWAINVFKNIIRLNKKNKYLEYGSKCLAVIILIFGIYSMTNVNYFSKTAQMFNTSSAVTHEHSFNNKLEFNNTGEENHKNGFQGKGMNNGKGNGNGKGMKQASIIDVLSKYLSITAVFSIFTYYIDKYKSRKKLMKN